MRRLAPSKSLFAFAAAGLFALAAAHPSYAQAQAPQASNMLSPGARAGNSVVPSTHSPGCSGLMCDSDDPRRIAATPPPPCQGLLCGVSPYGMSPPVTASDVARVQAEQARAQAAAAASPAPVPEKSQKRRRAKVKSSRTVASRTPDPAAAAAPRAPQ